MPTTAWWQDFRYANGVVHVKKTGIDVPLGAGLVSETAAWLAFHARVEAARLPIRADGPRLWFAPDRPRPWYLLWPALQLAGMRLARVPGDADLAFVFEDRTIMAPPDLPAGMPAVNAHCLDVSKSRVASVFEDVFGRALGVDPERWHGPIVSKSEANGRHDGVVIEGPAPREPGRAYQRLIDNLAPDGCVEDIRCSTVGGEIPVAFIKRREAGRRFANANAEVSLCAPGEVLSDQERARIRQFCAAMGLDWGGLDVLRDRASGEIFIVDVNKTDMGPPIALPLDDKMKATRAIAVMFRQFAETLVSDRETA